MAVIAKLSAVAALGNAARGIAEAFAASGNLSSSGTGAGTGQVATPDGIPSRFDRVIDGLNRLPRPLLAFGTLGLFVYAMVEPESFGQRMVGLNLVPDPLWWLLGAVVGFYFGAREAYYFRRTSPAIVTPPPPETETPPLSDGTDTNPALQDWRAGI